MSWVCLLLTHIESTVVRGSVTLIHLSSDLSEGGPFMTPLHSYYSSQGPGGKILPSLLAGEEKGFLDLCFLCCLSWSLSFGASLLGLAVNHSVPSLPVGWTTVEAVLRKCSIIVTVRLSLCCDAQPRRVLFCGIFFLCFELPFQMSLLPNMNLLP